MTKINSSLISYIHYNDDDGSLDIQYKTGKPIIYKYKDVPKDLYYDMLKADSIGKFFNSHIKSNYQYIKVE